MPPSPDTPAAGNLISDHLSPPSPDSHDVAIAALIDTETHHLPENDYLRRCRDRFIDITFRLDAVNWILKVHAFYQFRPVTAFLSVNFLDRFLSCSTLPRASGWAFQLLSVACLSLAAKMEEPHVPLLLDLQLFEPRFVFEPKTVQRMELWVMSNLKWRLRSVTPFDYLHYFIAKLPSSSSSESTHNFFSTASDLILSTARVIDFLGFAPSIVAAAAVLCSTGRDFVSATGQWWFHHSLNKEMVRCCHQLMEEYVVDTCLASRNKESRAEPAAPSSPVGVLDAASCVSCDTPYAASIAEQAEPANKRLRSSSPDRVWLDTAMNKTMFVSFLKVRDGSEKLNRGRNDFVVAKSEYGVLGWKGYGGTTEPFVPVVLVKASHPTQEEDEVLNIDPLHHVLPDDDPPMVEASSLAETGKLLKAVEPKITEADARKVRIFELEHTYPDNIMIIQDQINDVPDEEVAKPTIEQVDADTGVEGH
ncbi:hypothetical protein RJT34_25307 [Clitoria ternatea]|uniref:B-like cyclin n=1 Tax=Clitoria ternatea TaxID=43366 RepID=A0AAN9FVU7_CLITE